MYIVECVEHTGDSLITLQSETMFHGPFTTIQEAADYADNWVSMSKISRTLEANVRPLVDPNE